MDGREDEKTGNALCFRRWRWSVSLQQSKKIAIKFPSNGKYSLTTRSLRRVKASVQSGQGKRRCMLEKKKFDPQENSKWKVERAKGQSADYRPVCLFENHALSSEEG